MPTISQGDGEVGRALSRDEVVQLADQVGGLTAAGLPLTSGLRALGEELSPGPLRRLIGRLARSLEAGSALDAALEAQGRPLPRHLRGLVLAGVRSRRLDRVLGQYIEYQSRDADLRRSIWLSLAYPLMGIGMAVALYAFLAVFLVVQFEAIFRDFGVDLPVITIAVLRVAWALRESGMVLLALCGALAAVWLASSLVLPARWGQSLACRVPVLGSVWRLSSLAGLFHLLGLLLESEIPLTEALTLAEAGAPDVELGLACRKMAREVGEGRSLADAIARRPVMPRGLTSLLHWAERSQALPDTLLMLGELYEARARSQASFAATVCGISALFLVGAGCGITITAVMLPLVGLISRLAA